MLPQIKRPGHDDGEVEIEVVDVRNVDGTNVSDDDPTMLASNKMFRGSSAPPPNANAQMPNEHVALRPSHLKKGVFGDEPTQLMPAKNSAKLPQAASSRAPSVRPPPSSSNLPEARSPSRSPARNSERPHSTRPAGSFSAPMPRIAIDAPPPSFKMRDREDSHTMLRPLGDLSDQAKQILAESKASAAATAMAVPSAGAIKAQVDAARAKRLAEQRARAAETLEVTPVSISERFVVKGRPAAPWAIAFVAMGIFAGVTTVVFTGGRASAIASFIDPARDTSAVAAAAPQSAVGAMGATGAAPIANDPAANLLPGAANANAPAAVTGAPLDVAPMTPSVFSVGRASTQQTAQPQAAQPTPPAAVAAQSRPTPKADPAPRPAPVAKADPKPDPKPADPPKVADAPKVDTSSSHASSSGSHHGSKKPAGGGGDVDSAAAADALAKAQLENSL